MRIWMGIIVLLMGVCPLEVRAQAEGVRLDFSIYYPGENQQTRKDGARKSLKMVEGLHYAVGNRNVSLHIKQARQTILYPYRGKRKLSVFRLKNVDGQEVRDVVASVTIPHGVRKAIFILLHHSEDVGGFRILPFWMNPDSAQKGQVQILNMSGQNVAMLFNKGKAGKAILKSRGGYTLKGDFKDGSRLAFTTMEAYITRYKDKPYQFKVLHRDLMANKDDTSVYLMVRKQQHFLELLSLSLSGADNPRERERLKKLINPEEFKS